MFPIASHDQIACIDGWPGMWCSLLVAGSYVPLEPFSYCSRTEVSTTFFNSPNLSSKSGRTSTLPSVDDTVDVEIALYEGGAGKSQRMVTLTSDLEVIM
jgi:hypothetical protein